MSTLRRPGELSDLVRTNPLDAERSARRRAEHLQALSSELATSLSTREVADIVAHHLLHAFDAYGGGVLELTPDRRELVMIASMGYERRSAAEYARLEVDSNYPACVCVRNRTPEFVGSLEEWTRAYGFRPPSIPPRNDAEGSFFAIPLLVRDECIGCVTVAMLGQRTFSAEERAFAQAFADQCAQALHRARLFQALREHEALLTETQSIARLGSWRWDVQSNEITWDDGLCSLFEVTHAEAPRDFASYLELIHPEDRAHAESVVQRALGQGQAFSFDHRIILRDGSIRYVHGRGRILRDSDGRVIGMRGSSQDVTDRKETEAELARLLESERAARAEAEQANRVKSEFLAVMSHELRTPLNAIQGHAQLLEMGVYGPVTDAQLDALRRIDRAQRWLLSLINEVLNFAKVNAGALQYDLQPLLVRDLLKEIVPLIEPQVLAKGLTLVQQLPQRDRQDVRADRDKLGQVLLNLLTNAVKFTNAGGTISIELVIPDAVTDPVLLHVRDTGIGIPRDKLDSIFEPFVQVNASLTREHSGTGLGLAISRDLVRGMGGDLFVESEVGTGSTFTVVLPRA